MERALKEFVAFPDSAGEPRPRAVATGLACDDKIVAAVAAIGAAAQMLQRRPVRVLLATRLVGDRDKALAVGALPALAVFQIADRYAVAFEQNGFQAHAVSCRRLMAISSPHHSASRIAPPIFFPPHEHSRRLRSGDDAPFACSGSRTPSISDRQGCRPDPQVSRGNPW